MDALAKITQPHAPTAEEAELAPYLVDLRNSGKFFCSGVLVAADRVLTAAHCFVREKKLSELAARIMGQDYQVRSVHTLADQDGKVSEDYLPNFDVAVLEIEKLVRPDAHFPSLMPADAVQAAQGSQALMAGYGVTASSRVDLGELRFGWTRIKRVATAGRFGGTLVVDAHEASGPCMGDSGGPLFLKTQEGWQLAGLVHGVNWYTNPAFFGEDPCAFEEATYVIPGLYLNAALHLLPKSTDAPTQNWVDLCEKGRLDRDDVLPMKMITLKNRFKSCEEIYRGLENKPISLDFGASRLISARTLSLLPRIAELKADLSALQGMTGPLPEIENMSIIVDQQKQLDYALQVKGLKTLEIRQNVPRRLDYGLLAKLPELVDLRLNQLDIDELPSLARLGRLEHLELALNRLENLHFLAGTERLTFLSASSNRLRDISGLSHAFALKTLVLSNNLITQINALKGLDALEYVALVNNRIQDKICPRPEEQEGDVCAF